MAKCKNNKIKLLVIDDNLDDCRMLSEFFSSCKEIDFCGFVLDGYKGLEKVKKDYPDIVLTDFIMPKFDGFEVVKNIKKANGSKIKVIVLSGVGDVKVVNKAFECGADYYVMKPVSLAFLKQKIISVFSEKSESLFDAKSINICMKDIGIPTKLSGYDYAVEAVNIMLKSKRGLRLKEISGEIADNNYTTVQCVDACLHNAILKAHEKQNRKYTDLFGRLKRCPSNYVFLRTLREYIEDKK